MLVGINVKARGCSIDHIRNVKEFALHPLP